MQAQVQQSLLRERLMATLSGFFGGLAVLIATIGLYGVMSYMVARRRIEIGVRMALGADAGQVVRMIVREAACSWPSGSSSARCCRSSPRGRPTTFLYGLKPGDPGDDCPRA